VSKRHVLYRHPSLGAVNWFQINRALSQTALSYTERCAFRNKISNIILHYCGFRQQCYSETALSEARYSGGYLYFTLIYAYFCVLQPFTQTISQSLSILLWLPMNNRRQRLTFMDSSQRTPQRNKLHTKRNQTYEINNERIMKDEEHRFFHSPHPLDFTDSRPTFSNTR
jgi:hypothetical protein